MTALPKNDTRQSSPWDHLNLSFYPDTPPVSASQSRIDLLSGSSSPSSSSSIPSSSSSVPSTVSPDEKPVVAVLGVGYVGSHLVDAFRRDFTVIGFDVSQSRVRELSVQHADNPSVSFTSEQGDLMRATHFLIAVPTLLRADDRSIDSSYLRAAIKTVAQVGRRGSTVVIESSVAVGMTRDLLGPLAVSSGFYAGMSPERVDPGRSDPPMRSIPKIISGLDDLVPGSLDAITRLYSVAFTVVVPVSRPEVAEMTKLYENCQRMMCIAYANEMADACTTLGVDPYEVCDAAATKPFGYMPYQPGLGVGGHCIPVNPFYLLSNCRFPLLEAASAAMWSRPAVIAERTLASLLPGKIHVDPRDVSGGEEEEEEEEEVVSKRQKATRRVLVVGMAFKSGQSSLSNSPGLALAKRLAVSRDVDVTWADTLVKQEAIPQIRRLPDIDWRREVLGTFDLVVIAQRQTGMDLDLLDGLDGTKVDMWCHRPTRQADLPKAP